jgi:branched-chain amino acid transport system permease protein
VKTFLNSNKWVIALVAVTPILSWLTGNLDDYVFRIMMYAGINVILAVSLNLINGITGQFSLGHAGFMAVGAYVSASITYFLGKTWFEPQVIEMFGEGMLPWANQIFFLVALVAGGFAAALLGLIVGLPSLRLRGDYLAIVTLGFGEIIGVVIRNIDAIGGSRGLPGIPPFTHFSWVYLGVVFTVLVVARLVHSSHGRAFLAVREDEIAAEAVGVSTTRYKVMAFVLSSFFAGIAGGLFAHFLSYLNPSTFSFLKAFEVITMVVLGGMGSLSGSIIAAICLTILPEALRPLQSWTGIDFRMVIYSLLLITMMLTRPNGLFGKKEIWPFGRKKVAHG